MKFAPLLSALLLLIFFTGCDDNSQQPNLPELQGEKITYHFQGGFSYRILQYDEKGKVNGLISGVTYPEGTFENTHHFIYEGNVLKEIRSQDATIWSFKFTYGKKGELSETKVFLDDKLKEFYAFSYDIEGHLISEITWGSDENDKLLPISQRKYRYDNRHNVIESQQFIFEEDTPKLTSTILYKDFDDKVNSEYLFLNNLHHPFVRFCKNNPRTIQLNNENGTSAEQKFVYEYNSQGHVTKRSIENDPATIDFVYKEVK